MSKFQHSEAGFSAIERHRIEADGERVCDCCDCIFPKEMVLKTDVAGLETWACEDCRGVAP